MKFLIISGNPKKDGLCFGVTAEIARGASENGADVEIITTEKVARCRVCGDGWGPCRNENYCSFGDDNGDNFNEIQQKIKQADALCFVTPVYWGEVTESMKSLMDRLRRCEFNMFGCNGEIAGKKTLLVAVPGGSGNGLLTCLQQMERFCQHTGAEIFDFVGVNKRNQGYKRVAAYEAAKQLIMNNE
ncbi:MAG: flavodoxin family protein [Oscillospiraceae bacterium]|nr:flavodoxin family protein [Oscillospiraceae bacterium]